MKVSIEDDTGIQPYVTMCSCKHMTIWQACMYGYKGKTEIDRKCVRQQAVPAASSYVYALEWHWLLF